MKVSYGMYRINITSVKTVKHVSKKKKNINAHIDFEIYIFQFFSSISR